MSSVDELLEQLGLVKPLNSINLMKGYWQISLSPSSQKKTAFSTPFGNFQFKTFWPPWGCCYLPTAYKKILSTHHQYAAAYIDDTVYGPPREDPLQHLRMVLKAPWDAGLTANPMKCILAVREVTYSGYHV